VDEKVRPVDATRGDRRVVAAAEHRHDAPDQGAQEPA
jgi:hypothetical protein